ncbi:hypothetical protein HRW14_24450 [Streptomyces lunaelactis]|uniref:hypothetical protein n=1 Tax=Streptomyces lunaelactis TaxID=1535768 RepID=UPI00158586B5|nr:hypothetical protein [Streptomyces lunaelactis]NUK53366.1 hypothetical protein [Streptomyces lunaelactis]
MPEYQVTWTIDLDASSPVHAARKALAIHRNPESWATIFTVQGDTETVTVDLDPEYLDPSGNGTPQITLAA